MVGSGEDDVVLTQWRAGKEKHGTQLKPNKKAGREERTWRVYQGDGSLKLLEQSCWAAGSAPLRAVWLSTQWALFWFILWGNWRVLRVEPRRNCWSFTGRLCNTFWPTVAALTGGISSRWMYSTSFFLYAWWLSLDAPPRPSQHPRAKCTFRCALAPVVVVEEKVEIGRLNCVSRDGGGEKRHNDAGDFITQCPAPLQLLLLSSQLTFWINKRISTFSASASRDVLFLSKWRNHENVHRRLLGPLMDNGVGKNESALRNSLSPIFAQSEKLSGKKIKAHSNAFSVLKCQLPAPICSSSLVFD